MARTGINIRVKDTVLGAPIDVNATSLLIANVPVETFESDLVTVEQNEPFAIRSVGDLVSLGLTEVNANVLYKNVVDFYNPTDGIDNSGVLLWCVASSETSIEVLMGSGSVVSLIRRIVEQQGYASRPRNVLIAYSAEATISEKDDFFSLLSVFKTRTVEVLESQGIRCVYVIGFKPEIPATGTHSNYFDLSEANTPFVGVVLSTFDALTPCVGLVGGVLSSVSVGTSIGDGSLPPIYSPTLILGGGGDLESTSNVLELPADVLDILAERQYIFLRPRPPKNGLWFNDGATANDPDNALSTLEAARTICAIADDLQTYFNTYINSRVPVTASGDIQPAYKQTVLDNAFDTVIQPYIDNGDISDARISLVAQNNDMVGTRTWEVSLSILPALTLRWIEGFVFYVNRL